MILWDGSSYKQQSLGGPENMFDSITSPFQTSPMQGTSPIWPISWFDTKKNFGKVEDLSCRVWLEAMQHCLGAVFMQKQKSSLMINNLEVWGKGRERPAK